MFFLSSNALINETGDGDTPHCLSYNAVTGESVKVAETKVNNDRSTVISLSSLCLSLTSFDSQARLDTFTMNPQDAHCEVSSGRRLYNVIVPIVS